MSLLEISLFNPCKQSSASLLVAPITFVGLTALSVEINTKLETLLLKEIFANSSVAIALLLIPSSRLCSTIGTCL